MVAKLVDQKSLFIYALLSRLNAFIVERRFGKIEVSGAENLPEEGAFLLVCNHVSRWDGLLIYHLLGRPANFMVSPNELKGLQGIVLRSMGAFPASLKFDLHSHIKSRAASGEVLVVFPEGDIFRDGSTHPFKSGAARFALNCTNAGLTMPVVPVALTYGEEGNKARVAICSPVGVEEYAANHGGQPAQAVRSLTERLHREVCHLRATLGARMDAMQLFNRVASRSWTGTGLSRL